MIKAVLISENQIIKYLGFMTDNEMYYYQEGFRDGIKFWNGGFRIVKVEDFPKNTFEENEIINNYFD